MHRPLGFGLFFGAALAQGCAGPSLDLPERGGAGLAVDFGVATTDDRVPLAFRARVRDAPLDAAPWLLRGELSDYHARAVKRGELPAAVVERAVPVRYWRDGADCALQPEEWLEPESTYTLAFTTVGVVRVLRTSGPLGQGAGRLFPPPGRHAYRVSVWCDVPDAGPWPELALEPGNVALRASAGMAGQPRAGCVTLEVQGNLTEAAVLPPLAGGWFDPTPWLPLPPAWAEAPQACAAGEDLQGACLAIGDTRLHITAGAQDVLVTLTSPASAVLSVPAGARRSLLSGLSPDSALTLEGSLLTSTGEPTPFRRSVTTASARRHLVLNEVLANPLGPEPDAEWIELVNDSALPAALSRLWLEDSAGHVPLPDVELDAGEIALLVSDGFHPSGLDVPIPDGVRLLRLPSLGARGLANGGEALLLVGPEGIVSRFPQLAAAHAGRSWARRTLDGADDDPSGFGEQTGLATPGAPNVWGD